MLLKVMTAVKKEERRKKVREKINVCLLKLQHTNSRQPHENLRKSAPQTHYLFRPTISTVDYHITANMTLGKCNKDGDKQGEQRKKNDEHGDIAASFLTI